MFWPARRPNNLTKLRVPDDSQKFVVHDEERSAATGAKSNIVEVNFDPALDIQNHDWLRSVYERAQCILAAGESDLIIGSSEIDGLRVTNPNGTVVIDRGTWLA